MLQIEPTDCVQPSFTLLLVREFSWLTHFNTSPAASLTREKCAVRFTTAAPVNRLPQNQLHGKIYDDKAVNADTCDITSAQSQDQAFQTVKHTDGPGSTHEDPRRWHQQRGCLQFLQCPLSGRASPDRDKIGGSSDERCVACTKLGIAPRGSSLLPQPLQKRGTTHKMLQLWSPAALLRTAPR